mmetsp:Transcript_24084/g.33674  ORF Transcript_24084/g.33674 Transcript_24084/m.33674 type:complete len:125 (-) Transcript_24084:255-629(-)
MPKSAESDPNYLPGPKEWEYDEDEEPEAFVGKDVSIYWPNEDKWFVGTVTSFNARIGKHHLKYKDGDKRWTRLRERTFSIVGFRGCHIGEEKCPPYKPKGGNIGVEQKHKTEGMTGSAEVGKIE